MQMSRRAKMKFRNKYSSFWFAMFVTEKSQLHSEMWCIILYILSPTVLYLSHEHNTRTPASLFQAQSLDLLFNLSLCSWIGGAELAGQPSVVRVSVYIFLGVHTHVRAPLCTCPCVRVCVLWRRGAGFQPTTIRGGKTLWSDWATCGRHVRWSASSHEVCDARAAFNVPCRGWGRKEGRKNSDIEKGGTN